MICKREDYGLKFYLLILVIMFLFVLLWLMDEFFSGVCKDM